MAKHKFTDYTTEYKIKVSLLLGLQRFDITIDD